MSDTFVQRIFARLVGCGYEGGYDYFWQATNPPYTKNVSERLSMMRREREHFGNRIDSVSIHRKDIVMYLHSTRPRKEIG